MATETQIGIEYALYGLNYAVRNNYRPTSGNVYLPVCVCVCVFLFFFFFIVVVVVHGAGDGSFSPTDSVQS